MSCFSWFNCAGGDRRDLLAAGSSRDALPTLLPGRRLHERCWLQPGEAEDSIPNEFTTLYEQQLADCEVTSSLRKLQLIAPEGLSEDRRVRVVLKNMVWDLQLPETALPGDEVICELPVVMPMDAVVQKRCLHSEVFSTTQLQLRELADGSVRADDGSWQLKIDAYSMLRGRRMGAVLAPIDEDEEESTRDK